ncbi:hypothetical protein BDW72DRAFT_177517 [Aspergillus terricola var. indicus]
MQFPAALYTLYESGSHFQRSSQQLVRSSPKSKFETSWCLVFTILFGSCLSEQLITIVQKGKPPRLCLDNAENSGEEKGHYHRTQLILPSR